MLQANNFNFQIRLQGSIGRRRGMNGHQNHYNHNGSLRPHSEMIHSPMSEIHSFRIIKSEFYKEINNFNFQMISGLHWSAARYERASESLQSQWLPEAAQWNDSFTHVWNPSCRPNLNFKKRYATEAKFSIRRSKLFSTFVTPTRLSFRQGHLKIWTEH